MDWLHNRSPLMNQKQETTPSWNVRTPPSGTDDPQSATAVGQSSSESESCDHNVSSA
jgi:hypothetical protein